MFRVMDKWASPFIGPFGKRRGRVAVAPTLQLAKIDSAGTTMTWQMDRNTTITDATGVTITADGGAVTPTYSSGSGTRVLTFTLSRAVVETEDQVTSYDAGTGNIVSSVGSVALATFSNSGIQSHIPITHSGEEIPNPSWNPTKRAIASGDWEVDAATVWDDGVAPTSSDRVLVDGFDVTISSQNPACRSLHVKSGTLTFDPTVNTRLTAATVLFGQAGVLVTGTDVGRVAADKTCEIVLADVAQNTLRDPNHWWNQLIFTEHDWDWTARGAVKTTEASDLELAVTPLTGHTSVTLAAAPTGWRIGDTIVIHPTDPIGNDFAVNASFGFDMEPEERVITGIAGAVVSFADPLTYDHEAGVDADGTLIYPFVENVTRNIIVKSENPSGTRGCVMLSHRPVAKLTMEYVEFRDLGRTTGLALDNTTTSGGVVNHIGTNIQGRYACHFHHFLGFANGTSEALPGTGYQATLTGLSINGFKKWGIVNHYASWMEYVGCTIYNGQTAGIVLGETGNEFFNEIKECTGIAIRTYDDGHVTTNFVWMIEPASAVLLNNRGACTFQPINNDWLAEFGAGFEPYFGRIYHLAGITRGSDQPSNGHTKRKPLYRGADVLGGVENTDYEVFSAHSTAFAQWQGNQAWASFAGASIDHFGTAASPQVHVQDHKDIGMYQNAAYIYGGAAPVKFTNHTANRVVERFIHISTQNNLVEIATPNYFGENLIPAFSTFPVGVSFQGGFGNDNEMTITGGKIRCVTAVDTAFAVTAGDLTVPEIEAEQRVLTVNGAVLSNPDDSDSRLVVFIPMADAGGSSIPMARNIVYLTNWQGGTTDYELYSNEQDGSAPAPYNASYTYGATAPGRTNDEEFAASGRSVGGAITPVGATTLTGVVGAKVVDVTAVTHLISNYRDVISGAPLGVGL